MAGQKIRVFSKLYWKISAIFLLVLFVFAVIVLSIFVQSARKYSIEVTQQLNHDLAENSVDIIKPFLKD